MQEILQKSVLARGGQDWLFGGGMCGIYQREKGGSVLNIEGRGETLLHQRCWRSNWRPIIVGNKGGSSWTKGGCSIFYLLFQCLSKLKKKTTLDFVTHMDFYMKASQ